MVDSNDEWVQWFTTKTSHVDVDQGLVAVVFGSMKLTSGELTPSKTPPSTDAHSACLPAPPSPPPPLSRTSITAQRRRHNASTNIARPPARRPARRSPPSPSGDTGYKGGYSIAVPANLLSFDSLN
ncbi:hypothetical protein NL676_018836 [Syzygium grande]|nr:hypothetical protein NL676_018836 [Syzygium grande]